MTVIPIPKEDTPESRTAALADSVCGLLTRVVHNLTEVREATNEWFRRDPLDVEMIYHTGGDSIIFSARHRPTVPSILPVIIGQVVHGCRQVFDYIEKNKRVALAAFPDPWPPPPDPLYSLIQDLDNALKHDRLPVVCGAMLTGLIEFRDASGTLLGNRDADTARLPHRVESGGRVFDLVATLRDVPPGWLAEGHSIDAQFNPVLVFDEALHRRDGREIKVLGTPLTNLDVIDVLGEMLKYTTRIARPFYEYLGLAE